jgi:hypothetical protein
MIINAKMITNGGLDIKERKVRLIYQGLYILRFGHCISEYFFSRQHGTPDEELGFSSVDVALSLLRKSHGTLIIKLTQPCP